MAGATASPPVPHHHGDHHLETARLAELLGRSARGQEGAFAEFYDQTVARVHGVALRVLKSRDHAAEVTQEVYVQVWRQAGRYSAERGSPLAWLTTLAHRRAVDRLRTISSEQSRNARYAAHSGTRDIDHVWEGVEQRLDAEWVQSGLATLSPVQRQALSLAYFGGHTQSQVAFLLQLPLGTVKTRIRDGLIGLRHALGVER